MSQTVLVTGGTGFIGSHVISQLFEAGYKVRVTARSTSKLRSIFPTQEESGSLEIVEVPSLTADHVEVLRGVDVLIHCAAPVYLQGDPLEDMRKGAYDGSINIVKAAIGLGIKKIIVTGTIASLFPADLTDGLRDDFGTRAIGPESWGSVSSVEDIDVSSQSPGGLYVYSAAKMLAEKKIWEIADQHPNVDITTILPCMVTGPFLPTYPFTSSPTSLGTNGLLYDLLDTPNRKYVVTNPVAQIVDVRDVAKAHVLAITAPPLPDGRHKRLISFTGTFTWKQAVEIISSRYPEVEKRLPIKDSPVMQFVIPLDASLTSKALGFGQYISVEDTILAGFQAVLDWEKRFKA